MLELLNKIDKRNFILVLVGTMLIVVVSLFSYVLWPEVKSYRTSVSDLSVLRNLVANNNDIQYELGQLKTEIGRTKRRLKGDMADLPEKEMEAYIIGVLQNISWDNEVNLIGVKPVKGSEISIFQEVLFKVKLSGDYFDLYNWFVELREQLGFIVIKNLNLSPVSGNKKSSMLLMDLTIASYKSIKQ